MKIFIYILAFHIGLTFILLGAGIIKLRWKEGMSSNKIRNLKIFCITYGSFAIIAQLIKIFVLDVNN